MLLAIECVVRGSHCELPVEVVDDGRLLRLPALVGLLHQLTEPCYLKLLLFHRLLMIGYQQLLHLRGGVLLLRRRFLIR